MKIKGKVVDYALLITVGIALILCLYDFFIVSEASLAVRVVLILTFVIYVVFLPKRIRQIQSSERDKEAEG